MADAIRTSIGRLVEASGDRYPLTPRAVAVVLGLTLCPMTDALRPTLHAGVLYYNPTAAKTWINALLVRDAARRLLEADGLAPLDEYVLTASVEIRRACGAPAWRRRAQARAAAVAVAAAVAPRLRARSATGMRAVRL